VLLSFRLNDMSVISGGPGKAVWWDKIASKFDGWTTRASEGGRAAVPNCVVRRSAYIAPCVLMPSFVNLGAYVDSGTMVDTWATVGSCAQSARTATSPAAPASAVCSSRCRRAQSSWKTIASSARARRLPKA